MKTLKIDNAWHFMGSTHLPDSLQQPPVEIGLEGLDILMDIFDVMLKKSADGRVVLALDAKGKAFRTR